MSLPRARLSNCTGNDGPTEEGKTVGTTTDVETTAIKETITDVAPTTTIAGGVMGADTLIGGGTIDATVAAEDEEEQRIWRAFTVPKTIV